MQNLQPAPVTDGQRTYALDILNTTRDGLRRAIAGLTDAQLRYKPAPDRWSIAECVEHIALVEKAIFAGILKGLSYPANPDKRAEIQVSDTDLIKAARSRAVTLPAPDMVVPTGRFTDAAGALADFERQRETVIAWLPTATDDLRTHYFRHIAFGWLDSYQAILLLATHSERHRKQIEEVKLSPEFPA